MVCNAVSPHVKIVHCPIFLISLSINSKVICCSVLKKPKVCEISSRCKLLFYSRMLPNFKNLSNLQGSHIKPPSDLGGGLAVLFRQTHQKLLENC